VPVAAAPIRKRGSHLSWTSTDRSSGAMAFTIGICHIHSQIVYREHWLVGSSVSDAGTDYTRGVAVNRQGHPRVLVKPELLRTVSPRWLTYQWAPLSARPAHCMAVARGWTPKSSLYRARDTLLTRDRKANLVAIAWRRVRSQEALRVPTIPHHVTGPHPCRDHLNILNDRGGRASPLRSTSMSTWSPG
jgi:hypothetical protein